MKNKRIVDFQRQRIAELEKKVKCLESDNRSMEKDIDLYKRIISSKDLTIEFLNAQAAKYKMRYDTEMQEVFELKANLRATISDAKASRVKYEKQMKTLIDRIGKGK